MGNLLKMSGATSIALHATVLMAASSEKLITTRDIARRLGVSEAHLSKVLQRLGKAGLVRAVKGPGGGFILAKKSNEITLSEVYENIEGPLSGSKCLFEKPICNKKKCILNGLLAKMDKEVRSYFTAKKISDLIGVFVKAKQ